MSEYVIMPSSDYKNACDVIREASGKNDLIKSGELSSEITNLASKIGKVSFKSVPLTSSRARKSVAYGNGKFVLVNYAGNLVDYSTDGENWEETSLPLNENCNSIDFCRDRFIVAGSKMGGSTSAAFSIDGVNWTAFTLPYDEFWNSATYGNGLFVIVGSSTDPSAPCVAYSNDCVTWNCRQLPRADMNFRSVTYGDGKFVAITLAYAAYSTDGINWTKTSLPDSNNWESVTYGDGKFVAITCGSGLAAYSTDGINWTKVTLPSSRYYMGVTYGGGKFVAVAEASSEAVYSTDGIHWSTCTLPFHSYWKDIAYGDNKLVAVSGSTDNSNVALCDFNSVGIV